ncbi:MAG: thiamine-monophosphate kinase, partial [Phycisphaerales bacterium]|nr:thiamine-monophosphate kinase [Phycisphaerales bacterium]
MPGEFDFIDWVRARQPRTPLVPVPAGDDLAVLAWPGKVVGSDVRNAFGNVDGGDLLLVGVDQVLDGVHFDSAVHGPRAVGRKAMNRNLSDCAAMGCLPAAAVTTFALPRGAGEAYARELYLGLAEAGDAFGCPVVGGDTGSWAGRLAVTVTILGRAGDVRPVTRDGAAAGDGLWVSGPLGGSILGRHLTFAPRIAAGRALAAAGAASAMLDLSDGLSRDVRHLCRRALGGGGEPRAVTDLRSATELGAVIAAAAVPVHADAVELSARDGRPALDHALHDGEDYELLAAVPPAPAAE